MKTIAMKWKLLAVVYIFAVMALSFSARANELTWIPEEIPAANPSNTIEVKGEITLGNDGRVYILTYQEEVYELQALNEEFSFVPFEGQIVSIRAFEPKHSGGPVFQTYKNRPLDEEVSNEPVTAVLIVLKLDILE